MPDDHPFRADRTLKDGTRGLFWLIPFDGDGEGRHLFNDHNHARNFVRYLFSQSKAHPASDLTRHNLVREFADSGNLHAEALNENPDAHMRSFLSRRFPKTDAHRALFDDGCFPIFVIAFPDGSVVSNLCASERDRGVIINHPYMGHLTRYMSAFGAEWESEIPKVIDLIGDRPVSAFSPHSGHESDRFADMFAQGVVRKLMGAGRDVLMTVSHVDQPDHNPVYHVHRLVRLPHASA